MILAKFKVEEYWKGTGADEITVGTFLSTCAYFFDLDESYLVYAADYGNGIIETIICDRTQPLEGAKKEIKLLRKLREEGGNSGNEIANDKKPIKGVQQWPRVVM